jgi:type VI secretion system secreted protein Hcp
MFLKIETPNVTGEASDSNHTGEIQVLSWSHSFNQPTSPTRSSAGGGTVEQANHSDFSFTKYIDAATDDLLKSNWSGKMFAKATLTCYRADGDNASVNYLTVVMENVIVSNFSISGGAGDLPTETVTLSYGVITYTYVQQKSADGTASGNQPVKHDLIKQQVS